MMVFLIGASGYVGGAFAELLRAQGRSVYSVSREEVGCGQSEHLARLIRAKRPSFLINAAGFTGKPNVDACEEAKSECLAGNAVLPGTIRRACEATKIRWGHVSSGCIFSGIKGDGSGFDEEDPPNFCFRTDNCSFYSGSKALGEEVLDGAERCYVWRLRIPFNHVDGSRNYLSKLQRYETLLDATNSLSHLGEFVQASIDCFDKEVPFGVYNLTNTGSVTTREVVKLIEESRVGDDKEFQFFESEEQFMQIAAETPRSNCVLDNSKALAAGLDLSSVHDAIRDSLANWIPEAVA